MPRRGLQLLFIAALGLAATYFWNPSMLPGVDAKVSPQKPDLPQTYLDNSRSWSYDEAGNLASILEAKRMEQLAGRQVATIEEPRFYSHSGNDKTWTASAARGRYQGHAQRLLLRRNVVLEHDQTGTRLTGHALDIELKNKIARSKRKITITQGNNRTSAQGMVAHLDQETVTLGPNVESTYVQ